MPKSEHQFPLRQEVIDYLGKYEDHYQLNVQRSTEVTEIKKMKVYFTFILFKGFLKPKQLFQQPELGRIH